MNQSRVCKKCGSKDFYVCSGGKVFKCKPCEKERRKTKYHANPEASKAGVAAWRKQNPERSKEIQAEYRANNPEKYQAWLDERNRKRRQLKVEVLSHYSSGVPACSCCGEREVAFLAIDHIDGGGTKHRATIKTPGSHFYSWLKKFGFPIGYRVLCHNCNFSYGAFGYCPHTREGSASIPADPSH